MNQHTIQRSYLAQFALKRHVRVVDKDSLEFEDLKPNDTGFLIDFQSVENEEADRQLETNAISYLHSLKKKNNDISDSARGALDAWIALHLSRNPREIGELTAAGISYDKAKHRLFNHSLTTVREFDEIWRYEINAQDEPLIVSDQPIMFLASDAIVFPFSPRVLFILCNGDPRININLSGRMWGEVVNEMSFFAAHSKLFCRANHCPDLAAVKARSNTIKLQIKRDFISI